MTSRLTKAVPAVLLLLLGVFAHARANAAATPESPRLAALKRALESGRREALGEFWLEVSRAGAPLVEPVGGDAQNLLVTFLRQDNSAGKFVAVFPFARVNPLPHLFA